MITSRGHGILDYLVSTLLILAPWLLGFSEVDAARNTAVGVGLVGLLSSLFTNYELGLVKAIPLSMHLTLDMLAGLFLAASPWLFGFADQVFMPHLIVGLLEIGAAAMTQKTAYTSRAAVV
jgi:hypothetical protein